MKRSFPTLFAIFAIALFACSKNSGGNGGGGEEEPQSTAEFQFETTSEDICSGNVLHGTYYAGAPMTENEYIVVNINVTKPGTIFFATESVNGFDFAIADTVDETGVQEVRLQGKGMPLEPGNNVFEASTDNAEITFTIPVIKQAVQIEDVPTGIYMKGTFGGENFDITFAGNENNAPTEQLNGDSVAVPTFVSSGSGSPELILHRQYLRDWPAATEEDFLAFFDPRSYAIAFDKCGKFSDGIWVEWKDDAGASWVVSADGNQEESSYTIVGVEDGHRTDGKYYVKVKAYLTCKLYKSPTEMRKLDNVEIVSCFVMDKN